MQTETKKTVDLGQGSVGKLIFKLAIPAITAQIINLLYNVVDRIFIGHLEEIGAAALTGVGVAMPVIMLISAFAGLIGMGGAPRAAILLGRQDKAGAERVLGNCVTAIFIISAVLTTVFLVFKTQILMFFGASAVTLPYAESYMQIYAAGTIFVQTALGLNMFITTQGFASKSMLTVIIGAVINIILDPILMFGFRMGVRGAALATVIAQGVSAIWVLCFLTGKKSQLKIQKKYLRLKANTVLPVLALGVSPFIMQSTESLISICYNTSLLKYGSDLAVGSMTILTSIMQFSMLPLMGITQGAQPVISYNFGAENTERVKKGFRILIISCLSFSAVLWGLCMGVPQIFAKMFTDDAALIELTKWSLRIFASGLLFFGAQIACQQTFIAIGNAKVSLFLALFRKVALMIPLIFILPYLFADKVMAVFLAEPISDVAAVIVTVIMFSVSFRSTMQKMEMRKQNR